MYFHLSRYTTIFYSASFNFSGTRCASRLS
jgi:hypothetical protein